MIRGPTFVQLSGRDRRALKLGAWLVAPSLVLGLVVIPYLSAVVEARDLLATQRAVLSRELAAVHELSRDRATLAALGAELSSMAPRLFGGTDAVTASASLARYVSTNATRSGLHVEQVETETRLDSVGLVRLASDAERPERSSPADLRVSLRARGHVVAIYDFLRAMEQGPKLVHVSKLEVVRASDTDAFDGTLTLTAILVGRARVSIVPPGADTAGEELPRTAAEPPDSVALPETMDRELTRDPFRADGRLPNAIADAAPRPERVLPVSVAAIRLLGTVVRPSASFALCQLAADVPRIVHVGEKLGEMTLISIEQGRASFQAPHGGRLELSLSTPRS